MELLAFLRHMPCLIICSILSSNSRVAANTDIPVINHWSYPVEGPATGILLIHEGNRSSLVQDRCNRDTLLYLRGSAYLTRDGFGSASDPLRVPSQLLQDGTTPVLLSATFAGDSLIMSVSGIIFTYSLETRQWTRASGIPDDVDITNVASFQCCYNDTEWCQEQDNSVVAYNSHISSNTAMIEYFLSSDQGRSFSVRHLQVDFDIKDGILGATVLGSLSALAFLVQRDDMAGAQFVYDCIDPTDTNLPKPVSLPFKVTGNQTSFAQLESGLGSLVIWDSKDIYYSAVSGKAVVKARVHAQDPLPALDIGQTVQQVISNKDGDFAMLTTNGDLYFGREGLLPKIVKLPLRSPLPCPDHSCVVRFAQTTNKIQVLYPADSNATNVIPPATSKLQMLSEEIYVQQRLAKVAPPLQDCQHQGIMASFHDELFYLDLGQTLELNVTFIPGAWERNSYMVTLSNPGILSVNSSLQDVGPMAKGVTTMKLIINVALVADTLPEGRKDEARGMSTLSVSVYDSSLMCHHKQQAVARVVAGCPPDRNIRIRKNGEEECAGMRGYVYIISKDAYDPTFMRGSTGVTATEDKEVVYDFDTLGCPFVVYYQDMLKPIVELYDGDTFVEEVKEDYVLNEVNGMFTFGYEKTAQEAGCKSQPQSWLQQLTAQDSPDPATAWTRQNYRNCSVEDTVGLRYPNQPYEVLSSRNSNQLKWLPYNSILVFNVSVLDPDYSFCQLRGKFAVQVYGVLPSSTLPPLRIMLGTCGLGLAALVAAYIGQKVWPGEKDQEEEKEKQEDEAQEMSTAL
ncbi:cation channel sperm-associated protein subunit delta-like [Patiria miniata]|uniref:Cation channel sperm-associated auxiliary subunit delta n=1 Tax=Patiria miniata TaxID=46514 RepID=A0A913ZGL4_PATMI|nr:cation channel sperm-associated protein subunit delta-like [Patiria miniata]